MIRYLEDGSLFDSRADALVNPVNCDGYMGKGIALEFKRRFPEYFPPYKQACDTGKLIPGHPFCVRLIVQPNLIGAKPAVVMFPTKDHWRDESRIEWIDQGLAYLRDHYHQWRIGSIAMPQVGCGLGGLTWEQVKPLIEKYFADEPVGVEVYVHTTQDHEKIDSSNGEEQ